MSSRRCFSPPMSHSDENRLAGRVLRYAKVSKSVGGLAAKLVGERYLGISIDRRRHAEEADVKGSDPEIEQISADQGSTADAIFFFKVEHRHRSILRAVATISVGRFSGRANDPLGKTCGSCPAR